MTKEFKKGPKQSTYTDHSHAKGEAPVKVDALRAHLRDGHGWTRGMFETGRCDGPEGETYMRMWHEGAHVPLARPPR